MFGDQGALRVAVEVRARPGVRDLALDIMERPYAPHAEVRGVVDAPIRAPVRPAAARAGEDLRGTLHDASSRC
jgi:hypothetical protein